jgi:two-component system response regulator PilR (NtrC family)
MRGVSPDALALLEQYAWPGNIRELENVVERALVLGSGDILEVDALPPNVRGTAEATADAVEIPEGGMDLEAALDRIEQRYIELALQRTGGVQTRAAELLGVSFRQFRYKLQKHSLRGAARTARSSGA